MASLEREQAAELLARMPEAVAGRLQGAMQSLGAMAPPDCDAIIREFLQDHGPAAAARDVEFDPQLAARFKSPSESESLPPTDPFGLSP